MLSPKIMTVNSCADNDRKLFLVNYKIFVQGGFCMDMYFGDTPLCYTNSVAMMLYSYGYNFRPEYLEAIMVMGNGASIVDNNTKYPLIFFDNGLPDVSISNCLHILGFEYEEFFLNSSDEIHHNTIIEKLKLFLTNGSVVVGPLDMGYLTYQTNFMDHKGVDHFVSVFDLDDDNIYFHDPAGYPCMKMNLVDFLESWKASNIIYKRGAFSMWGNIQRTKSPTNKKIYQDVSLIMKKRYEFGDTQVIENYAKSIKKNGLNQKQKKLQQFFSFKLASTRNLYMSKFLKDYDPVRANIKEHLAVLFGKAHLESVQENYLDLANTLINISNLDEQFKKLCIQYKGE